MLALKAGSALSNPEDEVADTARQNVRFGTAHLTGSATSIGAVGMAVAAATAARHYALNLIRDIPPAVAPDADTAALLDRGCQNLQASLTSLQSAVADPRGTTWTRSASLFDLVEQRGAAPGSNGRKAHLALHDLRLIDGALAELADALGMDITSSDTGPAGAPFAGPPDSAA
jgi:hypothetical protein